MKVEKITQTKPIQTHRYVHHTTIEKEETYSLIC